MTTYSREETTYSREDLKRLFHEGLSNDLLKEDPEIAGFFWEGLERAVTAHVFPNDPAQYFVAQAIEVKSPVLMHNDSGFTHTIFNGYHTSPVSAETLLVNTKNEENLVIISANNENISLKIPLPDEWLKTIKEKGFDTEKLEIDLYCDTQNSDRKQKAFLQLLQGCWPKKLALPDQSREYWPKRGVRPPIDSSTIDTNSQVSRLINFLKHPFESRFIRLPIYPLLKHWEEFEKGINISVNDSKIAESIEKYLKGSIKLNCVLFWNRAIGISDRQEYLKLERDNEKQLSISVDFGSRLYDGGVIAVLDCIDKRENDNRFYDCRWAFGVEPKKCYSIRKDDSNHRSFYLDFHKEKHEKDKYDTPDLFLRFIMSETWKELYQRLEDYSKSFKEVLWSSYLDFLNQEKSPSFFDSQSGNPDLFLRFVMSERWKGLRQSLKNSPKSFKEVLSIGDLPTFSMIEPPVSDNLAGWGERERTIGLLWLANGTGDFPFPQRAVVTRTHLATLLLRLMPEPLVDEEALELNDFEFSQVIEPRPAPWLKESHKSFAFVVTKIIVKKDFRIDKEKVDYYLEWLSRAVEPFCPAGTYLDIQVQGQPFIKIDKSVLRETSSSGVKVYKKVAVDVKATPSNQRHPADQDGNGKWVLDGEPTKKISLHLKIDSGSAIHSASAKFYYQGGRIGTFELPPLAAKTLNLEARNTALMDAGKSVLVEGDEVVDSYGNKLEVSITSDQVETQVEEG